MFLDEFDTMSLYGRRHVPAFVLWRLKEAKSEAEIRMLSKPKNLSCDLLHSLAHGNLKRWGVLKRNWAAEGTPQCHTQWPANAAGHTAFIKALPWLSWVSLAAVWAGDTGVWCGVDSMSSNPEAACSSTTSKQRNKRPRGLFFKSLLTFGNISLFR